MTSKAAVLRALRVLLVLLALGFCAYSVASQWDDTVRAFRQMSWYTLVGALVFGVAGLFAWTLGWRAFMSGLGSPLPLKAAFRISAISGLGKYVPGMVWVVLTQVELSREHHVPRARSFSASVLAVATTTACGLAVAAATLPLTSAAARREYWWMFPFAPVLLAALHPKFVTWALNTVLRFARQSPLEHAVSFGAMSRAAGWTIVGWLLFGGHLWLLCQSVGGGGLRLVPLAVGSYALAFVAGLLVFIAPGGLGAREAVLTAVLSPVLPAGAPLVVAISSRVVLTIADLLYAGAGVLAGRGRVVAPADGDADDARELVTGPPAKE
ncbi:lysylphosphatidylglycerol synthase transmembrane domain-containing protein [Actinomadura atramentaria]|uniref:lysylphosphatidylglycerol synthase transmembrane domain-containing protein n=1 Tax=Actinomadura atramentaria TaxID=1990 RepID=UPI000373B782|nr:lysylphosphatidylglycerol synthase transmembrane domain-containing protein [Actinomadura atramentaria]